MSVLIYTGVYDASSLEGAIASGALGVALKAGSPEELLRAIRRVAMGELDGGRGAPDPSAPRGSAPQPRLRKAPQARVGGRADA